VVAAAAAAAAALAPEREEALAAAASGSVSSRTVSSARSGRASGVGGGGRLPVYTMGQVAAHNSVDDCWLVVHGKVYDVTAFMQSHPAGVRAILRHAGTDATRDFEFHSAGARKLWKGFLVGTVHGAQQGCTLQ